MWSIGPGRHRSRSPAPSTPARLYIADGHHRSAAASRVAAAHGNGSEARRYFLAVLFPEHEMTILDYNRLLRDLNGAHPGDLARRTRQAISRSSRTAEPVRPGAPAEFGMFLDGRWYRLRLSILVRRATRSAGCRSRSSTRQVIEPLLGIADQRTDKRIDFVGGGRGLDELERRVNSGEMAVAFALYPTEMADLMAVADAGKIMPPKSTWFEPKLADGMVSHVLD